MIEQTLLNRLKASIEGMGLNRVQFGSPEMVVKELQRVEKLFKNFSQAKPSSKDSYQAALKLLSGERLDDWATDLVAAAISIPIKELGGVTVLESKYCDELFQKYENDADNGDLWRLTWYSLLNSYLTFDLTRIKMDGGMEGFAKLRRLLNYTWPSVDKQSGHLAVPDWVRILREENQLLSDKPIDKYSSDFLAGNTDSIKTLAEGLGIPASSWFWQELVLGAVRYATQGSDEQFRDNIIMLIELVRSMPVYRDKAISEILNRYYKCSSRIVHPELRDFVIHASVWKNPKLKAAGIATAWNQVPDNVWRMVMGWVNERNLKDFFDILAARRHADHGRLKFWSRYMNQISWTRLVFGPETIWQKNHNAGIRALLESEEGTYATLQGTSDRELDAFMMQIDDFIFVEFSKTGNGAYAYRASDLAFDLHADSYAGSTSDLKCGYYKGGRGIAKIIHTPGWEERASIELSRLGIYPDRTSSRHEPARSRLSNEQAAALGKIGGLTQGAGYIDSEFTPLGGFVKPNSTDKSKAARGDEPTTLHPPISSGWSNRDNQSIPSLSKQQVQKIVSKYKGAQVSDNGGGVTRRLWVTNPLGWAALEIELKKMGFKWSASRQGWYWNED